jgi:hypothetical protein
VFYYLKVTLFAIVPTIFLFQTDNDTKDFKKEWGKPVEGQQISIRSSKLRYASEERVILHIVYKNGGKAAFATDSGTGRHYEITVTRQDGKETPLTVYGTVAFSRIFGRSRIQIQPGEEEETDYLLSRIHDLTADGKYTITATRKVGKDEKGKDVITVISNKLEITIDSNLDPDYGKYGG